MNLFRQWQRFERYGLPIYVHPQKPDWFVAGKKADYLIRRMQEHDSITHDQISHIPLTGKELFDLKSLLAHLGDKSPAPYPGRENFLKLRTLKECWFHLTNQCNLSCRHCLFAASPACSSGINRELLDKAIAEVKALGCKFFYFTGGEPFVYPNFAGIVSRLFNDTDIHVIILTNGLLLEKNFPLIAHAPADRLHLQISLDGMEKSHDSLRGRGAFSRLHKNLSLLTRTNIGVTLSVAVNRENIDDLPEILRFAADHKIRNIHFLWHFVRGKGSDNQFVPPEEIWQRLEPCLAYAATNNLLIDNIQNIRNQVFSTPGTRFDLSNSGWESLTIGPDGSIYPSPALVGLPALKCGCVEQGIGQVWRSSSVLQMLRRATIATSSYQSNPLCFLIGGGDVDHSYIASGKFTGHDPYVFLYNQIALWLIARQAESYPATEDSLFLLKMGDVRLDCVSGEHGVELTHCNCVISLSSDSGHRTVREFYANAAKSTNEDIVNPYASEQTAASYIPATSRKRSYGCGSPVNDAGLVKGETLVDLGSGSGVECFQAAKIVGHSGRIFGIDMTDEMLSLANLSKIKVIRELGYDNIEFKKGFLESIPLHDNVADVVISNCVINLSGDKRRTLHEAFRILKSGGRLVVSDIVTDAPIPVTIKNNAQFRGECLGGAMRQVELIDMLRSTGFISIKLIKRFPYRQLGSTSFYSLTFAAYKPAPPAFSDVIYRGPFAGLLTHKGELLLKGEKTAIAVQDLSSLDDSVFVVDQTGAVTNIAQTGDCCGLPPELSSPTSGSQPHKSVRETPRQHVDCMVCGSELRYFTHTAEKTCYYCGEKKSANASCFADHFVCDTCHQDKAIAIIKKICTESAIEDMVTLMKKIRSQRAFAMHGPEHHALVPGIILSTYRARGGTVGRKDIHTAIDRGSKVPGGVCGFWGTCGAAIGAGIAISVILEATPLTPQNRQTAQQATARILEQISSVRAARCCQRETFLALQISAELSKKILPVPLLANDNIACRQYSINRECLGAACLLWKMRDRNIATSQTIARVI